MEDTHLLQTYPQFQRKFVKGQGVHLFDDQGNQYLDFLAGIAVVNLGHANRAIADAIKDQVDKLQHVSNYFENEYTQQVSSTIDEKITLKNKSESGKVFFSNSGAEANECAIKVAKKFGDHKRFKTLTAFNSFHGRTIATLSATGQPEKHKPFAPLLDQFNYFEFGNAVSLKENYDDECVAVMIEIVQGEGGVNVAEDSFYSEVQNFCEEKDLLLIVDEVQTGMCRTGSWFAFQHFDLNPDIVTMAKALGNGFPVGATWIKDEVAQVMNVGDHGSTYGGQPLALRVVNEVFTQLDQGNFIDHVKQVGEVFTQGLSEVEFLTNVRGLGLMIGVDIDSEVLNMDAPTFVSKALDQGLICNALSKTSIRFVPPLIVSEEDISNAILILRKVGNHGRLLSR